MRGKELRITLRPLPDHIVLFIEMAKAQSEIILGTDKQKSADLFWPC